MSYGGQPEARRLREYSDPLRGWADFTETLEALSHSTVLTEDEAARATQRLLELADAADRCEA